MSPPDPAETGPPADLLVRLQGRLDRLRKTARFGERLSGGGANAALSTLAAIMAYVPTQWLGFREGFWGAITALAVTQSEYGAVRSTARDQILGAGIGGLIALTALLLVAEHGLVRYGISVSTAVLFCWLANVASAARLAAITATIILLVPHSGSAERMYVSRVAEVAWGIAVAMTVAWTAAWLGRRFASGPPRSG